MWLRVDFGKSDAYCSGDGRVSRLGSGANAGAGVVQYQVRGEQQVAGIDGCAAVFNKTIEVALMETTTMRCRFKTLAIRSTFPEDGRDGVRVARDRATDASARASSAAQTQALADGSGRPRGGPSRSTARRSRAFLRKPPAGSHGKALATRGAPMLPTMCR